MNKLIFRKLYLDILSFFLLSSLAITLIVWVIQGVNLLDIVSEQGHAIKVYLIYSFLNIPKIFSKLITFTFFLSLFVIIVRYEENNEILVSTILNLIKKHKANIDENLSVLVNIGPGMFSTLRVAISVAKGIKISKNVKLFGFKNSDLPQFNLENIGILINKKLIEKKLIKPLYLS